MAFYHTGGCSCPVGCCDCGPANPHESTDKIVREYYKSLVPKDIFMLKGLYDTETYIYEKQRRPLKDASLGINEFYIGKVDPVLTFTDAVGICLEFYAWLYRNEYLHSNNGAEYMKELISALQSTGDFKGSITSSPTLQALYVRTHNYL